MSFSRIKYDECQYKQQLKRSTDIGNYNFFINAHESTNQCYSNTGPIGSKNDVPMHRKGKNLDFGRKADAESHLTNRVIAHNECNDVGKNRTYLKYKTNLVKNQDCKQVLNQVDTRFTHPLDAYRGLNTTEYKFNPYLHVSPQCQYNFRDHTYSRQIAKDTYKPPVHKFLDTGKALPKKQKKPDTQCDVCK